MSLTLGVKTTLLMLFYVGGTQGLIHLFGFSFDRAVTVMNCSLIFFIAATVLDIKHHQNKKI